jgi:GTPase SAR1 family protein
MALMNALYVKGVCPFCGEEFYVGDCAIVSRLNPGKILSPSPQGISRIHSRLSPIRLEGPQYTLEQACRQCPHCGNLLPYNFEFAANITIAIVGDIGSGKSHYIAALIHQLRNGLLQGQSEYLRLTSLTPEIDRTYTNEYLEPLFKNKRSIAPTMIASQQIQKPLIYEITTRRTSRYSTRFNILLYDVAGEDYVNPSRLIQYSRHVLNASAIIFLADPMTMSEISGRLPAHLQSRTMTTSRSASDVLSSILASFERYMSVSPGSSLFATPVAIMVSKSDLLKFLTNRSSSYRFLERPQYVGKIDVKDLAVVDHEVRDLLDQFGERTLLQAAQAFPKVAFFATSATGYAPDKNGVFPAVEPIRCLDPLLWILWQLRILDET